MREIQEAGEKSPESLPGGGDTNCIRKAQSEPLWHRGEGKALKVSSVRPQVAEWPTTALSNEGIVTNYTFSYEDSTLLLEHKTFSNFNDSLKQLLAFGK